MKIFRAHKTKVESKLSLIDILNKSGSSRDQIYEMMEDGETFRYVTIKVKQIASSSLGSTTMNIGESSDCFLIQINDMSHKMFYSEIKERESILQMINATVSHELRNPLSAIIHQKLRVDQVLKLLLQLITSLKGF
jgi:signal transduction histidine kinase